MSCCNVLVVLLMLWATWDLGIRQNTLSSIVLQLHVLVEEGVRRAQVEHKEVEHPHTLAIGNHVKTVDQAGPRCGDARTTRDALNILQLDVDRNPHAKAH